MHAHLGDGAPVQAGDSIAPARNLFRERLLTGQPVRVLEVLDDGGLSIDPGDGRAALTIAPDALRHFRCLPDGPVTGLEIAFPGRGVWTLAESGMLRLVRRYATHLAHHEQLDIRDATNEAAGRLAAGDERAVAWLRAQPWGDIELIATSPVPVPDPARATEWHDTAEVRPLAATARR